MTKDTSAGTLVGYFELDGSAVFGRIEGDQLKVLAFDPGANELPDPNAKEERVVPLTNVKHLPALLPQHRVFAVALNYAPHIAETGNQPPEKPVFFYKPHSCFVAPGEALNPDEGYTEKFDYEGEIALVIGKRCRRVSEEDALSYVYGVTALMDGSARDRLRVLAGEKVYQDWLSSKAFENGSLCGPAISCGPAIIDGIKSRSISVRTLLNNEVVQEGSIGDLVFSSEKLIAFLSNFMTLLPGDIIATGTPGGVGNARGRLLQRNDRLEIDVTHVPELVTRVA